MNLIFISDTKALFLIPTTFFVPLHKLIKHSNFHNKQNPTPFGLVSMRHVVKPNNRTQCSQPEQTVLWLWWQHCQHTGPRARALTLVGNAAPIPQCLIQCSYDKGV